MSDTVELRLARQKDAQAIKDLYLVVAERSGGLARYPDEISQQYIDGFMASSAERGVEIVATDDRGRVVGELHAYTNGMRRFDHVLGSLTIAVHPDTQGQGIGRRLFQRLFEEISSRPEFSRVELFTQESNTRGRRLYESLGFRQEGRFEQAIRRLDGAGLEADIPMAWTR